MKKIINGKKYDTETATCVFTDREDCLKERERAVESYYRKNNGEFFYHAQSYRDHGLTELRDELIKPQTVQEVKKDLETRLTVEEYEAIFGTVEE
jgi:alpha-mannosidase